MNKLTKLFALLLVVALASTTFYVGTQLNSTVSTLGDEQNVSPVDLESSLEFDSLHVSIEGESKLHVNESSVYEAVVSCGSGNFSYAWGVEPVDEKVVFEYSGSTCSFMFVVATIDPYTLSVEVTDLVSGDKAFDSFTIYDPYTLPDLYLEASLADFVCRVKSDGAGWYFVSDGESGKTVFSSTVLLDATNYALTSTTSGNVLLDGVYFDYSLDIPVGISVTECVDGLTRVFVNSANSQGSPYTISVDSVHSGYYLAQDCMGRFIDDFSSSNLTALQDTVLGATTSGEIRLNEVAFDLALMNNIGRNVSVIESVNGLTRTFINPLDAQGNVRTISINGENYFAQDSANRICYTSTNALTISQNTADACTGGETIIFAFDMEANFDGCLNVTANKVTVKGGGWSTILNQTSLLTPTLIFVTGDDVTVQDIKLQGVKSTTSLGIDNVPYMSNLVFNGTTGGTASNVYSCWAPYAGIIGRYSEKLVFDSNTAYDNAYNVSVSSYLDGAYGIGGLSIENSTISNNWIIDQGLGGNARGVCGIELDYTGTPTKDNVIQGNHIINPFTAEVTIGAVGIRSKNDNTKILDNYITLIDGKLSQGIVAIGDNPVITGNHIQGSKTTNSYALDISSLAAYPTVSNNHIRNSAYGMRTQSTATAFTGGSVTNCTTGVVLSGSSVGTSVTGLDLIAVTGGSIGYYVAVDGVSITGGSITGAWSTFAIGFYGRDNSTVTGTKITGSAIGINLASGSVGNVLSGMRIICTTGINEASGADFTTVGLVDTSGCTTGIKTVGENTHVHLSWNATSTTEQTWLP